LKIYSGGLSQLTNKFCSYWT